MEARRSRGADVLIRDSLSIWPYSDVAATLKDDDSGLKQKLAARHRLGL